MTPILGICVNCRKAVAVGDRNALVEVTGWEKPSTKAITDRRPTGRVRCADCAIQPIRTERLL